MNARTKSWLRVLVCMAALDCNALPALALNDTIGVTIGSGKTANLIAFAGGNVISEAGICDATTANQCAAVSAAGAVKVDNSAVTQPVSSTTLALESGGNLATIVTDLGPPGATACASDTASCNQNQQLQRLAQRLSSILTALGSPLQAGGNLGTVTAVTAITNALPAGTNVIGHIICDSGCSGSGGTSLADNAAFTQGTTAETPIGCYLLNGTYAPITAGHVGVISCSSTGQVHTLVDNTLTALVNSADSVAPVSSVTASAGNSPVNSSNYLFDGTNWNRQRSGGVLGMAGVSGDTASGATNAGNPLQNGGRAQSAEPTAVTGGQRVAAAFDLSGKQIVQPYANRENALQCAVTITASTAATTCTGMGAQGAGVKIYITDLCVTRNDAGTSAATFTLNDGATTIVDLPNNGGGGGFCKTYNTPLVVAANTAFQGTSGTSLTSVHMSASGYKGY